MQYPSVSLEKAIAEFSKLPGIGRKSAQRLVFYLLKIRVLAEHYGASSGTKLADLRESGMMHPAAICRGGVNNEQAR